MQDNKKRNNIHIIGIPEGEEMEQGIESLFEKIMTENFPDLVREKNHTSTIGTEGPNQDQPREAHSKTHYNQNGKI